MDDKTEKRLLLATNNAGKVAELSDLLSETGIEVLPLRRVPDIVEVEESGTTFKQNARLKAVGYARQAGIVALADDSGLEVNALGGRPGVLSARYGGPSLDFGAKMALLLDEHAASGSTTRDARFVCALALADQKGEILYETEGYCRGVLAAEPLGRGGFGYDPIFIPDGFDQTFGQLPESVKQKISHRAVALKQIIPFLRRFYRDLT